MSDNAAPLILLTRPRAASDRFASRLAKEFGAMVQIVVAPLMEIVAAGPLPDLHAFSGVIFTSEVAARMAKDAPKEAGLVAWCVGDRTADAARQAGFTARSANGTAEDLVALIRHAAPAGRLLHLHGTHTRGDVAGRLAETGFEVKGQAIYDQKATAPSADFGRAMAHQALILAPLFSPRSARLFAAAAGPRSGKNLTLIALSDAVKADLPENWKPACHVSAAPTGKALIHCLRKIMSHDASVDGSGPLV